VLLQPGNPVKNSDIPTARASIPLWVYLVEPVWTIQEHKQIEKALGHPQRVRCPVCSRSVPGPQRSPRPVPNHQTEPISPLSRSAVVNEELGSTSDLSVFPQCGRDAVTVLLGLDLSVTAAAAVAVPLDWDG
jgi:hypothetical protein